MKREGAGSACVLPETPGPRQHAPGHADEDASQERRGAPPPKPLGSSPLPRLLPAPPPALPLFSSRCGICQEKGEEEGGGGWGETGIEVDPSVNKAASESNFCEKRQSQHEGGAVKEAGTGR